MRVNSNILLLSWICYLLIIFGLDAPAAFWLEIENFCERDKCTSIIALQARLIPFFSNVTLYHLKIYCRECP